MKVLKSFIILLFANYSLGELPPKIPKCQRNDPKISDCIAKAIEKLMPHFSSGDLGGGYEIPKIEPMNIKEMNFGESQGLSIRLTDVNIHGTSKSKVEKLRVNMKDLKFHAIISIPKFTASAKYQMKFKFLGNDLKTSGDYFVVHDNSKIILQVKLKRVMKNGIEVVRFEPIAVKFDYGPIIQLKISNLFGGNKAIEEIIHVILINNQEFAVGSSVPVIEANLSRIFTEIANKIVESTTFDEMFPA